MLVLLLVVGVGSFFAGMKYQGNKQPSSLSSQQGFRNGGGRGGARPVTGEIIGSDSTSVTVKLQDGSSKIVLISDRTTINKASSATKDDLQTGVRVAVFGQTNSDGSVTAQNIQINPMFRGGANGSGNSSGSATQNNSL